MNQPKHIVIDLNFLKLSLALVFAKIIAQGLLEHISGGEDGEEQPILDLTMVSGA